MNDREQKAETLAQVLASCDALDAPLEEKIARYVARSREILPDVLAAYDRLVAQSAGALADCAFPRAGEEMPSFVLPSSDGRMVHLDDLVGHGSLVISFNRGHWCPYCRLELRALMRAVPAIQAKQAEIVSIMPETGDFRDRMIRDLDLPFRVLTDVDLAFALSMGLMMAVNAEVTEIYRKLGIDLPRFQGREGWFLPIPATFVVGSDRRIKASFVNPDFRKRMTIEQIEAALDA